MIHMLCLASSIAILLCPSDADRDRMAIRVQELFAVGDAALEAERYDEALTIYQEALEINKDLVELVPDDLASRLNSTSLLQRIGRIHRQEGRLEEAINAFREGHAITEKVSAENPMDERALYCHSELSLDLGSALLESGDVDASLPHTDCALEIKEQFALADPTNLELQDDVLRRFDVMARLLVERSDDRAVEYYRRACIVSRRILEVAPHDTQRRYRHFALLAGQAHAHFGLVDFESCRDCWQEAIETAAGTIEIDPNSPEWRYDIAFAHAALGTVQSARREYENAIQSHELSIAIVEEMLGEMDVPPELEEEARRSLTKWQDELSHSRRCLIADGPWDQLLQSSHEEVVQLLGIRCAIKSRDGDIDEIVRSAEKLEELAPLDPQHEADAWRHVATGYAICAKLAVGWRPPGPYPAPDGAEPTSEQLELQRRFIARSLAALQKAIDKGLIEYDWLYDYSYFEALHGVPEFEALFEREGE